MAGRALDREVRQTGRWAYLGWGSLKLIFLLSLILFSSGLLLCAGVGEATGTGLEGGFNAGGRPAEITGAETVVNSAVVNIPDEELELAIRNELGKLTGDLTVADMESFNHLYVSLSGIEDLTGLEYAISLETLYIENSRVEDLSPLSGLVSLNTLSLRGNRISCLEPLSSLSGLKNLTLSSNVISELEPLAGLAQLDRLLLNGNKISDLEPLSGLYNLTYLLLGGNQISDLGPLAGLTGLDHLQFESNQVRSLAPLANLTELDYLQASINEISDLRPLEGLHRIRILDLNYNKISDISPLANVFNERLSNVGIAFNFIDITPGSAAMDLITFFQGSGIGVLYEPQSGVPEDLAYRVGYIPVQYKDDGIPTQPDRSPDRSMAELEERAEMVEQYFFDQSYGSVEIVSEFLADERIELDYAWHEYCIEEPDNWRYYVIRDALDKAGVLPLHLKDREPTNWTEPVEGYGAILVLVPDANSSAFAMPATPVSENYPEILNLAYLEDQHPYATWAHEIGHAMFKWFDYYTSEDYIWTRGRTTRWGLMGGGITMNPAAQVMSYNKVEAGWLEFTDLESDQYGTYQVDYLHELGLGGTVYRYSPKQSASDLAKVDHFIIEGRNPDLESDNLGIDPHRSKSELSPEHGITLYYQLGRSRTINGYDVSGDYLYKAPSQLTGIASSSVYESYRRVTLPPGNNYQCDLNEVEFSVEENGGGLELEVLPYSPANRQVIALLGAFADWLHLHDSASLDYELEQEFDLDLRVKTADGKIVGMCYQSGDYVSEIAGARASGNVGGGGPEWISLPEGYDFEYEIDTLPVEGWLDELVQRGMVDADKLAEIDLDLEVDVAEITYCDAGEREVVKETITVRVDYAPVASRLYGEDRYQTAIAISKDSYPDDREADAVVLARADDFADALPGGVLAYKEGGPLLITASDELHADVEAEIVRVLKEDGIIYILGGKAAVAGEVKEELEKLGDYRVERLSGENREETAYEIAGAVGDFSGKAIVAYSRNFPDALAISSYAAREKIPILTSGNGSLNDHAKEYLEENDIEQVYVVGGTGVISGAVFAEIEALVSEVTRLGGKNRYETAKLIAETFFPAPEKAALAFGGNFPDALAGGVNAAMHSAPVLLVQTGEVPVEIESYLTAKNDTLEALIVYGGPAVVSHTAVSDASLLVR